MVVEGQLEDCTLSAKNDKKHRLKQRFDVRDKLGQGTYGKVQLAVNRESGQEVAIKTIKKSKIESEQDLIRIRREIQIMSSIQHPHIIHIYEVFENKDKIVLVMQFASGGELYDYLSEKKVLSDLEARRIFRQIAAAVYYCHKNKICHRDLKLENILLDEKGNARIADFGLSNVFDEQHLLKTYCGSPLYASPEIVKGVPYYGPEVDCWSMGVLLYTLVYGAMPFDGSNFKKLVTQISEGDYFEPKKKSKASDLIHRLLTVSPLKRATIVDICTDFWVNQGYEHSLLQVAEDMANLTPVRLDLLLALTPESPIPSAEDDVNDEILKEDPSDKTQTQKSILEKNAEVDEDEVDDDYEDGDRGTTAGSFAFVHGSHVINLSASTPNLKKTSSSSLEISDEDNRDEFLPADLAAALEEQCIKNSAAERSFDGSLIKAPSTAHKSKKPRKSDSVLSVKEDVVKSFSKMSHHDICKGESDAENVKQVCNSRKNILAEIENSNLFSKNLPTQCENKNLNVCDITKSEGKVPLNNKDDIREKSQVSPHKKNSLSCFDESKLDERRSSDEGEKGQDAKSALGKSGLQSKKLGRAPGKIVIPKTFESSQTTPSPKLQNSQCPPVTVYSESILKNKPRVSERNIHDDKSLCLDQASISKNSDPKETNLIYNERNSPIDVQYEHFNEEKKLLAKGILKKGIARAKLVERKLSQQSSTESEVATPSASSAKSVDVVPSFYRTPKPYGKEENQQVKSKAEIILSPSVKSTKKSNETVDEHGISMKAPLWDSPIARHQGKQFQNWGTFTSTIDSEMNSWREQMEESLRRLSPDGSTEKSVSPVNNLSQNDDDKPLVPITRSYKKFTFTKDGACITETKKIYTTPGTDGSWTKVEKKTKITTRPGNADEFEKFRDLHLRNSSPLAKSDSHSSSGSNEMYDDIFDSWTGDTMMCNMMKIKDAFRKFSRDTLLHSDRRRNPFRNFHRSESDRSSRSKRRSEIKSGYSTDRESSENDDDDCMFAFDGSNPVVYGSQGLWQFLRPSRNLQSFHVKTSQPDHANFSRSVSYDRSGLKNWKHCESRASSAYNTSSRSQSRDRTQSPHEKVLRFVFESPSKEFEGSFSPRKESWSFRRNSNCRDSGINSDGYESEHSYGRMPSGEFIKSNKSLPSASVHYTNRQNMVRDFVKAWPKQPFSHPVSLHEKILNEAADCRRHKVEQWLNMSDENFPFGFHNESTARLSSKKSNVDDNVSTTYATVRPREYLKYIRSSSDKIGARDVDRFPSFGDSAYATDFNFQNKNAEDLKSKRRLTTYSPVSEENSKGSDSPRNRDSPHSVHHINFTFSDGRVSANQTLSTHPSVQQVRSFNRPSGVHVLETSSGNIQVEQVPGDIAMPVVQMRVSFNPVNKEGRALQISSQSQPSASVGLWQHQDQSLRSISGGGVSTSDREISPLPGIKKFSTEMVHAIGSMSESENAVPKSKLISGPTIECEVKTSVRNSTGSSIKGKAYNYCPQSVCYPEFARNACAEPCMDNAKSLSNLNLLSYYSLNPFADPVVSASEQQYYARGENTPDSLEDVNVDFAPKPHETNCSPVCTEEKHSSSSSLQDFQLEIKPLGVLWNKNNHDSNSRKNKEESSTARNVSSSPEVFKSIKHLFAHGKCCNANEDALCEEKHLNSFSKEGVIWGQKNNDNGTFSLLKELLTNDDGTNFNSVQFIPKDQENVPYHDSLLMNPELSKTSVSPLAVLDRLSSLEAYDFEELPGEDDEDEEFTRLIPSLMDDLQSPKQVLHQALRISETLKNI